MQQPPDQPLLNMDSCQAQGALGQHFLVELYGCAIAKIEDVAYLEQCMLKAARAAGATIVNSIFHHFSPFGVSGVVVLQESHLTIHTWPEYAYAAVDLFTCSHAIDAQVACQYLKRDLKAQQSHMVEVNRGDMEFLQAGLERSARCGAKRVSQPTLNSKVT